MRRLLTCLVLFAALLAGTASAQDRDDRYWAMLRDGTVVIGKDIRDWHHDHGNPHLNNKRFFDKKNPLLLLHDTTLPLLDPVGPFVEFANGDRLLGILKGVFPPDVSSGMPEHAQVELRAPLTAWAKREDTVAVRPNHIARIVFAGRPQGPIDPGTIVFSDGRRVRAKAMRWSSAGVRALTDNDSFTATWLELAEVHPPIGMRLNRIDAILEDVTATAPEEDGRKKDWPDLVGRLRTMDGAVLTFRRGMTRATDNDGRRNVKYYHAVTPTWALDPVLVPFEESVWRSYREPEQVPLSVLPGRALAERSYTGFVWPWKRDANVRGGHLASGPYLSDLGVGTHSYSEVAFDLPPGATRFTAWVGLDRAVGGGGCVRCVIYKDEPKGKPLWRSDIIRGGTDPVRIDIGGLEGGKRLVLVTEFAHSDRPKGADPADIRDEVDWLNPMVRVDRSKLPRRDDDDLLEQFPALSGWQLSEADRQRVEVIRYWHSPSRRWMAAMRPTTKGPFKKDQPILELTRRVKVTPASAWVHIAAARHSHAMEGHKIQLHVNGEHAGTIMNGDISTVTSRGSYNDRRWSLGKWAGKTVDLKIVVFGNPTKWVDAAGILWGRASVEPIVTDLPETGQPIKPDVPLASLKPERFGARGKNGALENGKTTKGEPLTVRGYPFANGYATLPYSPITYKLDPKYKRFVAVIGLAHGSGSAGEFRIKFDDGKDKKDGDASQAELEKQGLIWSSGKSKGDDDDDKPAGIFGRQTPGRQIIVDIPEGAKTITIYHHGKEENYGAWAEAGFMLE